MSGVNPRAPRKTNAAPQEWPVERKINLVLKGLRGPQSVTELCREVGVSTTRYYQWRQQFLNAARVGLAEPKANPNVLKERIQQLEAENARLRVQTRIFRDLAVAD